MIGADSHGFLSTLVPRALVSAGVNRGLATSGISNDFEDGESCGRLAWILTYHFADLTMLPDETSVPSVCVNLPGILAELAGNGRRIETAGRTVGDAISEITNMFPVLRPRLLDGVGNPSLLVSYYLNGDDIRHSRGFDTPVNEGDDLTIVAAVAGG